MIFPEFINGPQFQDGDLVTFGFDDAEVTLRLPNVPYNRDTTNNVCPQRDFRQVDVSDWQKTDVGNAVKLLVSQSWKYEDAITHDDIAHCFLKIIIGEIAEDGQKRQCCLNSLLFKEWIINTCVGENTPEVLAGNLSRPSVENHFLAKPVPRDTVDWVSMQRYLQGEDSPPSPVAYIPVNKRFRMNVSFTFNSIHYSDRKNPYSEELLHQLKLDLFDEFISFIHVDYSGATLEIIQRLKNA